MFPFDDVIVIPVLTDIRVKTIIYIGTEVIVENYLWLEWLHTVYVIYNLSWQKCIYKYIYTSPYDESGLFTLHLF